MTNEGLPIPDAEGDWEENINAIGTNIMTVSAIAKLRIAIRQDRKELRDVWFATIRLSSLETAEFFWVPKEIP